jgi:predicted Rossmann fold flavoprotein
MNLPKRLWHMLAELSGIATDLNYADMSKQQIDMLIKNITAISLKAKGKTTFKDEFVTCGGIALSDINFKSMESKKVNNLFFAGEVIDVDGITGGFNFQNAWTTGIIAAEAMAT